jgi:hypothetical protein
MIFLIYVRLSQLSDNSINQNDFLQWDYPHEEVAWTEDYTTWLDESATRGAMIYAAEYGSFFGGRDRGNFRFEPETVVLSGLSSQALNTSPYA